MKVRATRQAVYQYSIGGYKDKGNLFIILVNCFSKSSLKLTPTFLLNWLIESLITNEISFSISNCLYLDLSHIVEKESLML